MRVAMVIQSFGPELGGAERQLQRLGPLLERRGVESTVVTRRPPGQPRSERTPGLRVRRVAVPPGGGAASLAYTLGGARATARLHPDVVHVHGLLSPATIALLTGAALGVPVVAKVLSVGPRGDVDRLLTKPGGARRLALMARRFSAFLSLSSESDAELRAHGIPAGRLVRVPNGVDGDRFRPALAGERDALRRELGLPPDEPVTLYCGRFTPAKRLDLLVAAFRGVPGRLLLVGDGPERETVERLAAAPGVRGRVTIVGPVEDAAPLYRAADLYVSTSEREGMSGSVLEAMASGLCVAATPASGMAELLGRGTGVLLPDRGPAALAARLGALAGDPERRARLGAAARSLAASAYSLDATADRLVELYERLAG